jgi:Xaa-Pro aminopeptidase
VNSLKRINALRKSVFTENGFDGYLIFNSANMLYFLGFPGTSALLVPANGESTLYVYGVNYEQTKTEGKGFKVELVDALNVEGYRILSQVFQKENALEVNNSFVQALRKVKDKTEIELIRRAGELTSEGMNTALEAVGPGVKEYEVAAEIEYAMRKRGSGGTAFETIVASGASSAFPHGGHRSHLPVLLL